MAEILEFKTDDLSALKKLKNQLIEEYEEVELNAFGFPDNSFVKLIKKEQD